MFTVTEKDNSISRGYAHVADSIACKNYPRRSRSGEDTKERVGSLLRSLTVAYLVVLGLCEWGGRAGSRGRATLTSTGVNAGTISTATSFYG